MPIFSISQTRFKQMVSDLRTVVNTAVIVEEPVGTEPYTLLSNIQSDTKHYTVIDLLFQCTIT